MMRLNLSSISTQVVTFDSYCLNKIGHVIVVTSQWRHGVWNQRQIDCLFIALFRLSAKYLICSSPLASNAESMTSSWHNHCIDIHYFFCANKNASLAFSPSILSDDMLTIMSLNIPNWIYGRGIAYHTKFLQPRSDRLGPLSLVEISLTGIWIGDWMKQWDTITHQFNLAE